MRIQSTEEELENRVREIGSSQSYPNLVMTSDYGGEVGEDDDLVGWKIHGEGCPAV